MEKYLPGTGDLTDTGNVINNTNFIVHMHDGNDGCIFTNRSVNLLRVNQAIGARFKVGNFKTFPFQLPAGIQHCLVFTLRGDALAALFLVQVGDSFYRQVF